MRRLTAEQYRSSLRALLKLGKERELVEALPRDSRVNNYDNNGATQVVSDQHLRVMFSEAEALTAEIMADEAKRAELVGCTPGAAPADPCVRGFIERFGRLVHRRPLAPEDVSRYTALAERGGGGYLGLELVVQALLISPHFLFLLEQGQPDPTRPEYLALDGYSVATRLAGWLWNSVPDEALLSRAEQGALDTPLGIAAAAREMQTSEAATSARQGWLSAWLQLNAFETLTRDGAAYPDWNAALQQSMLQETRRFSDNILTSGSNLRDLLTANYTYLDATLARFYGLAAPAAAWERYELSGTQRVAGILTQGSILNATAPHPGVAPIKRGQFVRQALLCEHLPPPPPNIPPLSDAAVPADASERERLAAHRASAACSGCHQLLDPVGFGFSSFDDLGRYREVDAHGNVIDTSGELSGFEPRAFVGPSELAQRIAESPAYSQCVTLQLFRHALGRTESDEDECIVRDVAAQAAASGLTYASIAEGLASHPMFRQRRLPTP